MSEPAATTPATEPAEFGSELDTFFKAAPEARGGLPPQEPVKQAEPAPTAPAEKAPDPVASPASPLEAAVAELAKAPAEPAESPSEDPKGAAEPEEAPPPGLTENAGRAWKKLRTEVREKEKLLAEKERRILELEQSRATPAEEPKTASELADLRAAIAERDQRLAEADAALAVTRVESTSEYRASIQQPREQALAKVGSIARKYDVKPDLLAAAVQAEDDAALQELMAGFSERDRTVVYSTQEKLSELNERAKFLRDHASEAAELLKKRETEKERKFREELEANARATAAKVWEGMQRGNPILRETGNAEWDGEVRQIAEFVRTLDFAKLDAEQLYGMAYQGAAYPRAMRLLQQFAKENQELKSRVAGIAEASPAAGGAPAAPAAGIPDDVPFGEAVERSLGGGNVR